MTISGTNSSPVLNLGVGQTPVTVNVGDTSTSIVPANTSRSSVFLINLGNQDVWVACDTTALLDKGILLSKNGGSMLIDATAFTNGIINGIVNSGKTSDVTFQELNR